MAIKNPYNYSIPNSALKFRTSLNNKPSISTNSSTASTNKNKFDHYKEQAILTARSEELTLMLYNGIIKFLNQAKIFIDQKNIEKSHNAIVKAQDIITELNVTLNMDYEISKGLRSLYDFMNRRLMEANIEKDKVIIDEVIELAEEMRDTWKEAISLVVSSQEETTKENSMNG
ncbi:MAG: flagellar secretion chaperone FliS [Candidatus Petromonas sp.]|jgi:flagellar protein FliS|nr:flagellar secretion chaperone FliS [Candidatus Petromonas sp.]